MERRVVTAVFVDVVVSTALTVQLGPERFKRAMLMPDHDEPKYRELFRMPTTTSPRPAWRLGRPSSIATLNVYERRHREADGEQIGARGA
jgi:hypothetical protein